MNKLPRITLAFWLMKICATTLGETAGDLLSMTLGIGYGASSLILISFFLATLAAELVGKKAHPILYWSVILATSTVGTTMSDYLNRSLDLGYAKGSAILVAILLAVLALWRLTARDLSVENIRTPKVEALYWTAILVSNTLGTALGDFLADNSGLGFAGGALLITILIGLVIVAHLYTRMSKVLLFWLAFVLTRPLGATLGDLLTKPQVSGGLNLGTIGSSLVLFSVLALFVLRAERQQRDVST